MLSVAVIVHDNDILIYFLFQNGELADQYNSSPSYFDYGSTKEPAGPAGGDAGRLCAAFGVDNRQAVESVSEPSTLLRPIDTQLWFDCWDCPDMP